MKRLFALFTFVSMVCVAYAQLPFAVYTPAQPNYGAGRQVTRQQQRQQDNFQTINAYYVNSRGAFQKIRIKVNVVVGPLGDEDVYVRAYRDLTYNSWHDMNSCATPITQHTNDPVVIRENFDWKCYLPDIGTVYF